MIVVDDCSTDSSIELAQKAGAKIVKVKKRGYGSALIGGINSAIGKYVDRIGNKGEYALGVFGKEKGYGNFSGKWY